MAGTRRLKYRASLSRLRLRSLPFRSGSIDGSTRGKARPTTALGYSFPNLHSRRTLHQTVHAVHRLHRSLCVTSWPSNTRHQQASVGRTVVRASGARRPGTDDMPCSRPVAWLESMRRGHGHVMKHAIRWMGAAVGVRSASNCARAPWAGGHLAHRRHAQRTHAAALSCQSIFQDQSWTHHTHPPLQSTTSTTLFKAGGPLGRDGALRWTGRGRRLAASGVESERGAARPPYVSCA